MFKKVAGLPQLLLPEREHVNNVWNVRDGFSERWRWFFGTLEVVFLDCVRCFFCNVRGGFFLEYRRSFSWNILEVVLGTQQGSVLWTRIKLRSKWWFLWNVRGVFFRNNNIPNATTLLPTWAYLSPPQAPLSLRFSTLRPGEFLLIINAINCTTSVAEDFCLS